MTFPTEQIFLLHEMMIKRWESVLREAYISEYECLVNARPKCGGECESLAIARLRIILDILCEFLAPNIRH